MRALGQDPELDEVAFVPGPLEAAMFEAGDAEEGMVSTMALPPLAVGLMCAAHKLAIDMSALPALLGECRAEWTEDRQRHARAAAAEVSVTCVL